MAVYDDPVFVKALKLLNSSAKDSGTQILQLLEEVVEQKYGGTKSLNLKLHNLAEEPEEPMILLEIPKARGSRGPSPAFLGPSEKSSRSSTPPSEPVSIRTTPDRDDGDLALEIFEDDLFCTVCNGMKVTSQNRLLECNDCHSLYHQECHKPPVDSDANDPRLVWSCGDCTNITQEKALAKAKSEKSEKAESSSRRHKSDGDSASLESRKSKSDPDGGHLDPPAKKSKSDHDGGHLDPPSRKSKSDPDGGHLDPPAKKHKSDSDKSESKSSSKRSDKSHSSKSSHSGSSKQSSSSSSSTSSSRSESRSSKSSSSSTSTSNLHFNKAPGSPTGKTPSCTANIIAADRRLQNMKKKAAAKMQEKRSNPK